MPVWAPKKNVGARKRTRGKKIGARSEKGMSKLKKKAYRLKSHKKNEG
jgi:hypothetical protein